MTFHKIARRLALLAALATIPFVARAQPAVQKPAAAPATPGIPCCGITSINTQTGRISAKVNATGHTFEFTVTDRAQLASLRAGEPIYANFKTNKVSLDGSHECCAIVSASPAQAPTPPPPPPAPASAAKSGDKVTTAGTNGTFDKMPTPPNTVTPNEDNTATAIRGRISADSENARGETDSHLAPPNGRTFGSITPHTMGRTRRLMDDPSIGVYENMVKYALKGFDIQTALLAGHKYMINSCLGIKVNAGEFHLAIPEPDLRVVADGMVLTFTVQHITMNAFTVRLRPDLTDAAQPCHFSGKHGISGGADNVRYELHFQPVLDLEQCKIGSVGVVHQVWRIGSLHLDPLPQQVSDLAGNMVEDGLTSFANYNLLDRVVAALNSAADVQCHK